MKHTIKILIKQLKNFLELRIKIYYLLFLIFIGCKSNDYNHQIINNWEFQHNKNWLEASVPGNNFYDLLYHQIIPDPFYGNNEDSIKWVADRDWVYKSTFSVKKDLLSFQNHEIIFNGLDTYSEVFLNDSLILNADNMFRKWVVPINNLLKKQNTLIIKFHNTSSREIKKEIDLGYKLPGGKKVHTRKAGFHYGWDWGPKIPVSGIWKPVEIISYNNAIIKDLYIEQKEVFDSVANFKINLELNVVKSGEYLLEVNNTKYIKQLIKGVQNIDLDFNILKPKLWWPNGYGKQPLYDINVTLIKNKKIISTKKKKIGIRTVKLITSADSTGKNFYFEINGEAIFMKGANYIPQDNLQNRVTTKKYKTLLDQVIKSNMNMLRVWGGGIYENEVFYNLCDSLGVLVWQDFMFACAMYPDNKSFIENIRLEAIDNVKRLRNHTSIILWCGNNEIAEAWQNWGWQSSFSEKEIKKIYRGYEMIFNKTLPEVVGELTNLPYWESSPQLGRGDSNHNNEGDVHYWGVWHDAQPFSTFEEEIPRFMSEFGFQSFPQISTIKSFSEEKDWLLDSEIMLSHQKHPRGNSLIQEYMNREYNQPKDFKKFVYASQILQAEGMRIGLEAHRRSQPYCMGTLYWQLNDCWPVASWSSIDYYGNWKALNYVVRDVFAPIGLSITKNENEKFSIWIMSDKRTDINDTLIINSYNLKGKKTNSKSIGIVNSKDIGSKLITKDYENINKNEFIIATLKNKKISSKTIFTSKVKDIIFLKPNLTTKWDDNVIKIKSDLPAFQVYFELDGIKFDKNYLTMLPGIEYTINYTGSITNKENLLIWSLYDLNK